MLILRITVLGRLYEPPTHTNIEAQADKTEDSRFSLSSQISFLSVYLEDGGDHAADYLYAGLAGSYKLFDKFYLIAGGGYQAATTKDNHSIVGYLLAEYMPFRGIGLDLAFFTTKDKSALYEYVLGPGNNSTLYTSWGGGVTVFMPGKSSLSFMVTSDRNHDNLGDTFTLMTTLTVPIRFK